MSFTVYKSSAGSGKTFTLVAEYLKIILQEPRDFKHVLAITFTNKAAAEMKNRVLSALSELSIIPNSTDRKINTILLPRLAKETGLNEQEIAGRAARVLTMILHNYSDFSIGTIDSFSHRVIRSFAHDFGLPVQFKVETESTEMLTTAVDMLVERVGTDEELTGFLVRFLEVNIDDDQGWNIEQILVRFAQVLLDEEGEEKITSLRALSLGDFTKIAGTIKKRIHDFEQIVLKIGNAASQVVMDAGVDHSDFYHGNQGITVYFKNLSLGKFDKIQPNSYVVTTMEEDKWFGGKATRDAQERINMVKPHLQEYFQQISSLLDQQEETYTLNKLLAVTIFPMAVLNEIERMLTAFKKQSNTVHISEFNRRISSVVMKEPVPFIYERLGERYHHLMIDEFQDTSRMQWQNFIPLIENALASGYFNLVVGDGKQAIYRFRNGDVTQFSKLPKLEGSDANPIIRQREKLLESSFKEEALNSNFRSKREIVEFNNRFFTHVSNALDETGQAVYRDLAQNCPSTDAGGYVEITFLDKEQEDASFESLNYAEIVRILEQLKSDGYAAKDVAILCRNNVQASNIARELVGLGIDVVSSESLLLTQSPEVNFLVALHSFLFDRENLVVQTEIAGFLLQTKRLTGYTWPDLLAKITSMGKRGEGLLALLEECDRKLHTEELLALPLYDLFEALIRIFDLHRTSGVYLRFFLDAVLSFLKRDDNSAGDFQLWWERNKTKCSVIVPEGLEAVQTMTIHKSKGLQFPVVIFPFATERKRNTKKFLWVDMNNEPIHGLKTALLRCEASIGKTIFKEQYLEEERRSLLDMVNLLYVVMTRPEERLYIITTKPTAKADPVKSLPALFANFITSENLWQPGESLCTYGVATAHKQKSMQSPEQPREMHSFITSDWRSRISIRSRAPFAWDMDDPVAKISYGTRLHLLLSGIQFREDAGKIIHQAVMSGVITRDEQAPIEEMLNQLFDHPEIGRLYSPEVVVKTEPAILLPDGGVFRPDRVVFDNGTPVIVEYKTGLKSENHLLQIEGYGDLLLEMGYHKVEKYLVYLHDAIEVLHVN